MMKNKKGRQPITPTMYRTLWDQLKCANIVSSRKKLIWLVATWCWSGSFRIHEVSAQKRMTFDLTTTLLAGTSISLLLRLGGSLTK